MNKAYPRIIKAMRWAACLTHTEAAACIRDIQQVKAGVLPKEYLRYGGGEAVNHFGGPLAVLTAAVQCDRRAASRRAYGITPQGWGVAG